MAAARDEARPRCFRRGWLYALARRGRPRIHTVFLFLEAGGQCVREALRGGSQELRELRRRGACRSRTLLRRFGQSSPAQLARLSAAVQRIRACFARGACFGAAGQVVQEEKVQASPEACRRCVFSRSGAQALGISCVGWELGAGPGRRSTACPRFFGPWQPGTAGPPEVPGCGGLHAGRPGQRARCGPGESRGLVLCSQLGARPAGGCE